MQTERNKAVVQAFVGRINAQKWDDLDELVAPEFIRHSRAAGQPEVRSREQLKAFLRRELETFPDGDEFPKAELDIWMRCERFCGHGYGTDALTVLMRHLRTSFGIREFVIRPSTRNQRAVTVFEKAGFTSSSRSHEDQQRVYGRGEYSDTMTLLREF